MALPTFGNLCTHEFPKVGAKHYPAPILQRYMVKNLETKLNMYSVGDTGPNRTGLSARVSPASPTGKIGAGFSILLIATLI